MTKRGEKARRGEAIRAHSVVYHTNKITSGICIHRYLRINELFLTRLASAGVNVRHGLSVETDGEFSP